MSQSPSPVSVIGAEPRRVEPEEVRDDQKYGGVYKVQRPWRRLPTPDPVPSSMGQYLVETYDRPHVLERILHADIGDPEMGMEEAPPYVRTHPKGISLAVFPGVAEMVMDNKFGIVFVGNVAFRNPAEMFSFGGICTMNPVLMNCIPSTDVTPIPTFIYSLKNTPLMRSAARASKGSVSDKAIEAPASSNMASPGPARSWQVQMDTGHTMQVHGATTQEEARAHAMSQAAAHGTGCRVSSITDLGPVSSHFGMRTHPVTGASKFHKGIDIAAPGGTPIPAPQEGVVKAAGYSSSYGNYVELEHPDGTVTKYAHMQSAPDVVAGQRVAAGDQLGHVGSTGISTGNHLHFEVHDAQGNLVDPETWSPGGTAKT